MEDAEDRNQAPSERRRLRAREEGQAPLSRELTMAAGLGAACIVFTFAGPAIVSRLGVQLRDLVAAPYASADFALRRAGIAWLDAVGSLCATVALVSGGAVLLQTGFLFHARALAPDLARLDPRRGLKRVFGPGNAFEAGKSLAKLAVLGWALWSASQVIRPDLFRSPLWTLPTFLHHVWTELSHVFVIVVAFQAGLAVLDVGWTRWRFSQRLRMSREDLRQEQREAEGDPKVKARLRQLRQVRSKRRMMAAVAKATVVVTNPTHFAVALAYERGAHAAPRVVAKGADEVAARLRSVAEDAGVPVVANPPLARALFTIALDAEVPEEHFKVVAELIAYVWRLRSPAPVVR